jgi:hypothetical protein
MLVKRTGIDCSCRTSLSFPWRSPYLKEWEVPHTSCFWRWHASVDSCSGAICPDSGGVRCGEDGLLAALSIHCGWAGVTTVNGVQILGQRGDLIRRQRCAEGIAHLVDFPHPLIERERRLAQYHSCRVTNQALTGDLRTLTRGEPILAIRQINTDFGPPVFSAAGALFCSGLGISGARPCQTGRECDSEQDGSHPNRSNVASARTHDRPPRTQTACTDTDSITLRMNPDAFQLA